MALGGKGFGTASVLLGIVAVGFALVPVMALVAWFFSGLAIITGIVGRWRGRAVPRTIASWGLGIGIIAAGLALRGFLIAINSHID